MSISKINISEGCTLCGLCEQICPEVFELGDDSAKVKAGADFNANEKSAREAADSCPVNVIEVVD